MLELIDRATVLKYPTPRIKVETPYGEGYNRALEDAAELVTLMPAIEPERKKGHINICNHIEYCSECGKCLGIGYTNYCGYCGAELEVTGNG